MTSVFCSLKKERYGKGLHGKCTLPRKGYKGSMSFFQSFSAFPVLK